MLLGSWWSCSEEEGLRFCLNTLFSVVCGCAAQCRHMPVYTTQLQWLQKSISQLQHIITMLFTWIEWILSLQRPLITAAWALTFSFLGRLPQQVPLCLITSILIQADTPLLCKWSKVNSRFWSTRGRPGHSSYVEGTKIQEEVFCCTMRHHHDQSLNPCCACTCGVIR